MRYLMVAAAWDGRRVRISTGDDLWDMISLPIRLPDGEWKRVDIVDAKNGNPLWTYCI